MRLNNFGRQEVQVTGFGGHTRNRRAEVRTKRAKHQGATGRRKGAIKTLPRNQERPIERRQGTRGKRKRVRKNLSRRHIKRTRKKMKETQPEGVDAKRRTHWPSRAQTLNLTSITEKPPSRGGWMATKRETSSRLLFQKRSRDKRRELFQDPRWHVN